MAPSRIVRWAIILSAYNYSICYKSGKKLQNADTLSRLPRLVTTSNFTYHITPHTTTGIARAQLLMNRRLRSYLDRLFLTCMSRRSRLNKQHLPCHYGASLWVISCTQRIFLLLLWFGSQELYIVKVTGPLLYHVKLSDGHVIHRHVNTFRVHKGFLFGFGSQELLFKVTGPLSYHVKLSDGHVVHRHVVTVRTRHPNTDSPPLRDICIFRTVFLLPNLLYLRYEVQLNLVLAQVTVDSWLFIGTFVPDLRRANIMIQRSTYHITQSRCVRLALCTSSLRSLPAGSSQLLLELLTVLTVT